ncbi:MAG TPA: ABC transporter substrate-binding protein [Chloroflexota bacterium]|nr:ABC transporter substrate-binding protein [Chloroflexota bacterium]
MKTKTGSAVVLIALTLLAACGAAPIPSSAALSAKPASAGSSAPASAAAKGPIKVGVILTLTGPQATVGKDNQDALNLYLKSVNNTIAGRQIEPIFVDDQFKADVGLTKAKELVENQKVALLMGIIATPVAYAVAQYVKNTAHVPLLLTSNAGGEGMLTDSKYKSPYLTRWTFTGAEIADPPADWAAKQGYRKAAIFVDDYAAGIQNADLFASAFIRRGGSIVEEEYPPLGNADYGPYLARLNKSADVIYEFLTGVDGLRWMQQYATIAGQHKLPVLDMFGILGSGTNLAQLKQQAVGVVSSDVLNPASTDPGTQAFLKAWQGAYPGGDRPPTHDAAHGYASGQILAAALEKVGGQIENTQRFLNALYSLQIDTAKGPVKLDQNHDIVQNIYLYRVVKKGDGVGWEDAQTYHDVSDTWDRSAQELAHFPWEKMKGKWVGMTKDQLEQALK